MYPHPSRHSPPPALPSAPPCGDSYDSANSHADVLHQLAHRLTDAAAPSADLRDLPGAVLDTVPQAAWRGLLGTGKGEGPPPRVALNGCTSSTVERVLAAFPKLQVCSVDGLTTPGHPIDLMHAPRLRLFETTVQEPALLNPRHVPVLVRPAGSAPTFVPARATPAAHHECDCIDGLRRAIADDACRLDLIAAGPLRRCMADMHAITDNAYPRLRAGDPPFIDGEAERLIALLNSAPAVLLPANLARMHQRWTERLRDPLSLASCTTTEIPPLIQMCLEVEQVIQPSGPGREGRNRLPKDLATLMRLQLWAWPDAEAYVKAGRPSQDQNDRRLVAAKLRKAWEGGRGPQALPMLLRTGDPRPDADLLQRMGLAERRAPRRPAWQTPAIAGAPSGV